MKSPLIALVLAAAVAVPVFAQTQAPAETPRPDRRQQMSERMCRDMDARIAARIAWTEAKVRPTDAQRAAWNEFVQASRAAAAPMQALCGTSASARPAENDLAARLAEREKRMSAMLDSTRQMRAAVEKLQPVLTDEQKAALAQNMSGGRGEGRHGARGHHGEHGMRHGGRG